MIPEFPAPQKILFYTANLTQTGTAPPVPIILQNTIGNIVWSYVSAGNYKGTLTGAFKENKTAFLDANGNGSQWGFSPYRISDDEIGLAVDIDQVASNNWQDYTLKIETYLTQPI